MTNSTKIISRLRPTEPFNAASFQDSGAEPSKRPPPFSIRFTHKERQILDREAKGKPWAEHIRERLFGDVSMRQRGRPDTANHAALGKLLGELGKSRLASNMNQIAKAANQGALPVTADLQSELKEACADIRMMRDALISALGIKVEW